MLSSREWKDSSQRNDGGSMLELRKARRYQLSEIVVFSCERADGEVVQMTGVTHDLSTSGISFVFTDAVEIGARFELDLYLRP
jgi:hypothetical protein